MIRVFFITCLFSLILGCASDLNENVRTYQSFAFVRCKGEKKQRFDKVEISNGTLFGIIDSNKVQVGKACNCKVRQYNENEKGLFYTENGKTYLISSKVIE